jgi:DNA-binding PadR family transcriptional regulator
VAVKHVVLGLLARAPAHGYGLRRDLDAALGRLRPVPPSRLYGVLAGLRAAGFVVSRREAVRGRVRRVHEITPDGRAELRAWLARPALCAGLLDHPLLVKVAVLSRLGASLPPQALRAERTARERLLVQLRDGPPRSPLERLCDERLARHLEVELWLVGRLAERVAPEVSPRPRGSASR